MIIAGGRAAAAAATVSLRGVVPSLATYGREESANASRAWISGLFALPAAGQYYCVDVVFNINRGNV